ncbi:hypothetical protein L1049_004693 [Liquidambar formosana]|uniref:NAB domain-containing protein n=1 Tax=Liquidambar formosana TaxID=63359 RepID=A0AAP0RNK3_LIQFO
MIGMKKQSHWWWFEGHNSPRRSPWLQSTLAELDGKTKAMLKLVEEDADSFAQRAEMYYKKRPELINMVEDFYRAHRSLAERYDQVRSDSGPRLMTTMGSPFSFTKYRLEKLTSTVDQSYDSYSETFDHEELGESEVEDPEPEDETRVAKELCKTFDCEESGESEVDDPEHEDDIQVDKLIEEEEVSSGVGNEEVMKLREEIERLKEENRVQRDELMQKDEEKREVIRQLSLALEMLREENVNLKRCIARNSPKKKSPLEFNILKGMFLKKLFSGSSKPEVSVVAL